MTLQSEILLGTVVLLYTAVPTVMLLRGWVVRAGLSMTLALLMPIVWGKHLPDSNLDTPGIGFIFPLFLPAALLIFAGTVRLFQQRTNRRNSN